MKRAKGYSEGLLQLGNTPDMMGRTDGHVAPNFIFYAKRCQFMFALGD